MKYYLIIVTILISLGLQGQITTADLKETGTLFWGLTGTVISSSDSATVDIRPVCSKLDTAVLFNGIDTSLHSHVYISETNGYYKNYGFTTAVYRPCDDSNIGCPETWLNQNQICELCLKHINIKETRWYEDRYQKALDRLNKIKKQ